MFTHTVHMALVGYFIVFSFVTKPGQTLEFLLWGTIVPLNFLVGYSCSIVASTPQPMAYASNYTYRIVCVIQTSLPVRHTQMTPTAIPTTRHTQHATISALTVTSGPLAESADPPDLSSTTLQLKKGTRIKAQECTTRVLGTQTC